MAELALESQRPPGVAHLNACVTAQVEVKLKGVSNAGVHRGACWNITTLPNLSRGEKQTGKNIYF